VLPNSDEINRISARTKIMVKKDIEGRREREREEEAETHQALNSGRITS
jgi:hypothetical protein